MIFVNTIPQFRTEEFVNFLNTLGIEAKLSDSEKCGFYYNFEQFKEYAAKTKKAYMPIWLLEYGEANLKWLLNKGC